MKRNTHTPCKTDQTSSLSRVLKLTLALMTPLVLSACSFIELHPGARHTIFSNDENTCELLETFKAEAPTHNFFIERSEQAIAEELQILAQNAAFAKRANAIWPISEVDQGKQSFQILKCKD